jgi:Domain of unknown function (DUF1904)
MPNVYVEGCTRQEAQRYSIPIAGVLVEVLGVVEDEVRVIWRDTTSFRRGEPVEGALIVTVSWIRRPAEWFVSLVDALTSALRREVTEGRSIEIELREKWDDAAVNGQLLSDWSRANRR